MAIVNNPKKIVRFMSKIPFFRGRYAKWLILQSLLLEAPNTFGIRPGGGSEPHSDRQ